MKKSNKDQPATKRDLEKFATKKDLKTSIQQIQNQLDSHDREFDRLGKYLNQRFDHTDKILEKILGLFEKEKIENSQTRNTVDDHKRRIENLEEKVFPNSVYDKEPIKC